jgi:hypothetical protein
MDLADLLLLTMLHALMSGDEPPFNLAHFTHSTLKTA